MLHRNENGQVVWKLPIWSFFYIQSSNLMDPPLACIQSKACFDEQRSRGKGVCMLLLCSCLTSTVNSYGHIRTIRSDKSRNEDVNINGKVWVLQKLSITFCELPLWYQPIVKWCHFHHWIISMLSTRIHCYRVEANNISITREYREIRKKRKMM